MRKIKSKAVFSTHSGKLYVQLTSVMSPLVALCDGLPLTFFGKEKTPYLTADQALWWCEREKRHHSREKYEVIIAVIKKAMAQNIVALP